MRWLDIGREKENIEDSAQHRKEEKSLRTFIMASGDRKWHRATVLHSLLLPRGIFPGHSRRMWETEGWLIDKHKRAYHNRDLDFNGFERVQACERGKIWAGVWVNERVIMQSWLFIIMNGCRTEHQCDWTEYFGKIVTTEYWIHYLNVFNNVHRISGTEYTSSSVFRVQTEHIKVFSFSHLSQYHVHFTHSPYL